MSMSPPCTLGVFLTKQNGQFAKGAIALRDNKLGKLGWGGGGGV